MKNYYDYQQAFSNFNEDKMMRAFDEKPDLYSSSEGYTRGNMFKNKYIPYKNYQPQILRATNEKEQMFLNMSAASFAAHDLNLYLDLHPQDGNALNMFNQYREQANKFLMDYERSYRPVTISSDTLTESPFMWEVQPFPWNEGGM